MSTNIEPSKYYDYSKKKTDVILEQLDQDHSNLLNPFPMDIFPKSIQHYISENVNSLGFNSEFFSCAVLSAFGTALGNLYHLQVKSGWTEKPLLWIVVVGDAGDGKSHAMELPFNPIKSREKESYKSYKDQLANYQLNPQTEKLPRLKNTLMRDFTYEALCQEHDNNQNGLCIFADEIMSWVNGFSRYSSSSQEDNYLTIFNGKEIKLTRKGTGTIIIPSCCINLIAGTQKGRLHELYAGDRSQSGFLDRLLFSIPDKINKTALNNNTTDQKINDCYSNIFSNIFDDYDNELGQIIPYSDEAFLRAQTFDKRIIDKYDNELTIYSSMAAKFRTYIHRFALLIELIDNYSNDKKVRDVSISSFEKATKLYKYFEHNGLKIRDRQSNKLTTATDSVKKMYKLLPQTFTTSEALKVAKDIKISSATAKRNLVHGVFKKKGHGKYEKVIFS
ncbi:uncharacterized protein DUF3987 [Nonlabens dokdonensis]|uniref:DUF3987 domain-containing protein n=2 Tax=Nonlabens dokdonensis TaxID=328515 RepID=L7W5E9_NONDD|nr:DUF3987 domain-containing protein [Nonlabens dokdonensis]AGC76870.1 hypothetical protein DDD_1743 [Nonlabens dokdonensis DSW-6]PZX36778.1 uncharacterized protein DUF3987 [Nonlabens dokdonensis]